MQSALSSSVVIWNQYHKYPDLVGIISQIIRVTEDEYGALDIVRSKNLSKDEVISLLKKDQGIDMAILSPFSHTSLDHIKIPLQRGIEGLKVCLINQDSQEFFHQIKNISEFRAKVKFISPPDKVDAKILTQNDLSLVKVDQINSAYQELKEKPRGCLLKSVNIAADEVRKSQSSGITIEQKFLVYSEQPKFLYFSPSNKVLKERFKKGLQKILKEEQYHSQFWGQYGKTFQKMNLDSRIYIKLDNPSIIFKKNHQTWLPSLLLGNISQKKIWKL